jgi:RNA polymerase sigma factor (sigma-70 family)
LGLYLSERFGKRRRRPDVTLGRVRTLRAVEESADEREWWTSALAGSGEAFARVFDLHRDRVYRHALRLSGNGHDAEDVTAGAFLELWRRRTDVRLVEGSVLPWLLVTATNLSRNTARGLRRYRALIDSLPRSATARSADEIAIEQLEEVQTAKRVREAFRSLSKADAALIALTAFEGFSPAEAAAALGISDGAARARLHRARARAASGLGVATVGSPLARVKEEGK